MATRKVYVFNRFNRFWHWGQATFVLTLLLTGFEIHGAYTLFGFEKAVSYHTITAWSLISLWAFTIFWMFTTGEWKQYIPSLEKVDAMIKYYVTGIFTHAPHPFRLTQLHKHNPLQRMAYLTILSVVGPMVWSTGLLYIFHDYWTEWGLRAFITLEWVAFFHTLAAFLMLSFVIVHVYLITTGHTVGAHLKAMITGWEEVED